MSGADDRCAQAGNSLVVCINYNYPGPSLGEQMSDWAWAASSGVLVVVLILASIVLLRVARATKSTPPGGSS